jgi:uncharacterized protein HemX
MRIQGRRGQTGVAVLALIVALMAFGISRYTYLQVTQRADLQAQLTAVEALIERGRRGMADALRRLEERMRARQHSESPPRP